MKFNQYNYSIMAVFIILISVGLVNALSTPPFIMAVSENSPSSDVILGIDITSTLEARGYEMGGEYGAIFEDLKKSDLDNNIILYIFQDEATIIIGEDAPNGGDFTSTLEEVLNDLNVNYEKINSGNLESNDNVEDATENTVDDSSTDVNNTNNTIISPPIIDNVILESRECELDEDCDDGLSCTVDECSESEYKCTHITQEGCEFNGECITKNSILENEYCDGNSMKKLKDNKQSCTSSFECSSGNCGNGLCKSKGFFQTIGEWLGRIF